MTNADLIQAMKLMILARNWQGYLHFRRELYSQGNQPSKQIREILASLSKEDLEAYTGYFGTSSEMPRKFRNNQKVKNNDNARYAILA